MKRFLNLILIAVVALLGSIELQAAEYGTHPELNQVRFVVSPGRKLNVRGTPSSKGELLGQLKPGDIVYINDLNVVEANGYKWYRIEDKWGRKYNKDGYVTFIDRFVGEDNPNYDATLDTAQIMELEHSVRKTKDIVQWALWLIALVFAIVYVCKYFKTETKEKLIGYETDGMRRTFFFNAQPYISVLMFSVLLAAALASSLASLLGVGLVVLCLLYIVKILCYVVVWVGIIMCVVCIIATVCGAIPAIIGAALGGYIWYNDDAIEAFAEKMAQTGIDFFNELNLLGFTYELFMEHWQAIAITIAAPIALFLGLAAIWMLIAGGLILFERIMTARYNVKHPCPHCQQPSEPATYLSRGENGYEELPNGIALRPGMYGLFHITNPYTWEKMPTMLMNGRDGLARRCANCNHIINAEEGTELHIAMVGSVKSGKSTLTYRMIAEIFDRAGDDRVSFTDEANTLHDKDMKEKVDNIRRNGKISDDDLPEKTDTRAKGSTQLIIKRKHAPLPYRLFINDVGGELYSSDFQSGDTSDNSKRFFRNVNSILLIIDPLTTSLDVDFDPSDSYTEWLTKFENGRGDDKMPLTDLRDAIVNQIQSHGNNTKNVHLNIVLPKRDLGYIPSRYDLDSEESLKAYMREQMGLGSLLQWAEGFASLSVMAVGATSGHEQSNIKGIVDRVIVDQLEIKL